MGVFAQSECNDPRSLYYKRTLVRPKIPVGKVLLCVLAALLLAGVGFAVTWALWGQMLPSVLVCVGVFLLICILFAKRIMIMAVKIYQAVAPERVRKRCRYEPSCSCYMILSVEKYGFLRGTKKGFKRLISCKPPNGGYDLP